MVLCMALERTHLAKDIKVTNKRHLNILKFTSLIGGVDEYMKMSLKKQSVTVMLKQCSAEEDICLNLVRASI